VVFSGVLLCVYCVYYTDRPFFIAAADELEETIRAMLVNGQVAKFVEII
jgi:hypothetical protein